MSAGTTDLEVMYIDPVTMMGVAMDFVSGEVKNALGQSQGEIVPMPWVDTDGNVRYTFYGYETSDPKKFPGTWLTVAWKTTHHGVVLPTFDKKYEFAPASSIPADKTLIYWDKPSTNSCIVFYEVWRERGSEQVLVGRSFGTSFVDTTEFPSEYEARSWAYFVKPAIHKDGALQTDGADYVVQEMKIYAKYRFRSDLGVCTVYGRIVDLVGRGLSFKTDRDFSFLTFETHPIDHPQILGSTIVLPEQIHVQTTDQGVFSVPLIQDTIVVMRIPYSRFSGRFVVPRKDSAAVSELNLQILRE